MLRFALERVLNSNGVSSEKKVDWTSSRSFYSIDRTVSWECFPPVRI